MARKHVISLSPSSSQRQAHRFVLLGLFLFLYASNAFVMPSILGHRFTSKMSSRVFNENVPETTSGAVTTRKKFEEFKAGDEVDAVILEKNRYGTFCGINAEKNVLLAAPRKLCVRLELYQQVKAMIETIDLEKRQATIVIPDLEELVQDRKNAKTDEIPVDPEAVKALQGMEAGQALSGKVACKNSYGVWFDIGSAIKPKLLVSDKRLGNKLRVGEEVKLKVANIDVAKGQCSAEIEDIEKLVAGRPKPKKISTLEVGSVHVGHIAQMHASRGVLVDIDCVKYGRLRKPHPPYQRGQEVTVKVVRVGLEKCKFGLEVVSE